MMGNNPAAVVSVKERHYTQITEEGTLLTGNTLSARNEQFLETFPIKDGWCITITNEVPRVQLANLDNQILPTVLFTATLCHHGKVRATATSLVAISGNKDWESGESNARARLLEVIGIGRFSLDADDARHAAQTRELPGPFAEKATNVVMLPTANTAPESAAATASATATTQATGPTPTEIEPSRVEKETKSEAKAGSNKIPRALLTQIERRCAMDGKAVPDFQSADDARRFWAELNA